MNRATSRCRSPYQPPLVRLMIGRLPRLHVARNDARTAVRRIEQQCAVFIDASEPADNQSVREPYSERGADRMRTRAPAPPGITQAAGERYSERGADRMRTCEPARTDRREALLQPYTEPLRQR